ncbi:MAG: MBL fold metallo-hydrolase [Sphaerochaeta sp.]|nr:MBL fold metallo-hydrolase [Sphaerochaeta sp.]
MEIIFINVGYGDAILVKHNSQYGLIDGGSSIQEEFQGNRISLKDYLKKENITKLEFVIITHIHEDHVCGISEILDFVTIKTLYLPYIPRILDQEDINIGNDFRFSLLGYIQALNAYKNLITYAKRNNIACFNVVELGVFHPLGPDLEITVLEPSHDHAERYARRIESACAETNTLVKIKQLEALERDSNDHSLVLRIVHDGYSCVLAADNCPSNWRATTFSFIQNENVLKLPHHGQLDAVNKEFLDIVGVEYIVTSSSSDRRNNSSNPEVYRQLRKANKDIKFLFTDEITYVPFALGERNDTSSVHFTFTEKTVEVTM